MPPPPELHPSRTISQTSLLPRTLTVGWFLFLPFKFLPLNSLTAMGAHERPLVDKLLTIGNFNDFCPFLAFDS